MEFSPRLLWVSYNNLQLLFLYMVKIQKCRILGEDTKSTFSHFKMTELQVEQIRVHYFP